MNIFTSLMLGTIAALIPIINPFSTASMFLSLTFLDSDKWRNRQALLGCMYMFIILTSFLLAGGFIIDFFGISIPGMRIAGGILVSRVALNMLYQNEKYNDSKENIRKNRLKKDIAFFPLAMPSLSGPGSIAIIISMGTLAKDAIDYLAVISGIFIIGIITYITLRSASFIKHLLGTTGINAITKIMGFIIFCVGIQFIINGIIELNLFA